MAILPASGAPKRARQVLNLRRRVHQRFLLPQNDTKKIRVPLTENKHLGILRSRNVELPNVVSDKKWDEDLEKDSMVVFPDQILNFGTCKLEVDNFGLSGGLIWLPGKDDFCSFKQIEFQLQPWFTNGILRILAI